MSGTYRHGRTYCQVAGCHARVWRAVEIELPMAWEASGEYTVMTVVVGACRRHGHDVARRVRALLEARADYPDLLSIIERAAVADAQARADRDGLRTRVQTLKTELAHTKRELGAAEHALSEHRERAERARRATDGGEAA